MSAQSAVPRLTPQDGPRSAVMLGRKATAVTGMLALAVLISLQFPLGCGGSGTSGGGPPPPPPSNPVPAIVWLSPNSANAGAAAFTLTIAGENFLSSSTVQWNGSS